MAGISIAGVSKGYGPQHARMMALQHLDLEIADNQFVTLLGPSGCGKTTTLRLIAGYVTPDTGSIDVGGRQLSSPARVISPEARGMGMVFQNYAVWPHKTVYENVAFGLKLRKLAGVQLRNKVEEALQLVNLGGLEARFPNELSGGQQQRVALARSLVVEPDILLLDEPLSNLDAKLRERMRSELKQLQRRTGITFIYVTHDQAEALALSDQIAVMHGGRLQQYGSPFEVYTQPANRIVADFMGLVNFVPGQIASLEGRQAKVSTEIGQDIAVPVAAGLEEGAAVDIAIRPENITLAAAADAANRARIRERVFLGNICEYTVALPGGALLRVQTHPLQQFAEGDAVVVSIDPGQCSVFSSEPVAEAKAVA
ncbi:MAG: ABC transporter ATP-binding protein [Bosea sp. (in: a-proteobacteria)]|uniref:ABC transporter ATP-binding protein n=1 Tax=Bosea sp. (in: a-proteobacteria) TaxID=1871050 RepID=UPI003F7C9E23